MSDENKTIDMTQGSIWAQLLMFCGPVIIGDLFQQFYTIADTIIVGRLLGVTALAAVGLTGSLTFMVFGFTQGLCAGMCIITSQRFGAFSARISTEKDLKDSINTVSFLAIFITLVISLLSLCTVNGLLRMINAPDNVAPLSETYLRILFGGMIANTVYNIIQCKLRALGDSKTPLIFLIVASLLNIVLDYAFIALFDMGVAGAAYATVLAQALAAIGCEIYSRIKFSILRTSFLDLFRTNMGLCFKHLKMGVPMGLQYTITSIGVLIEQRYLNVYGELAIAGFTAGSRVESLVSCCFFALGSSMATFCGQNIGAKRIDRVKQGVTISFWLGIILSVISTTLILVFGRSIISLFVNADASEEVFNCGMTFMKIAGLCFPFLHILVMYRNSLQGIGYSFIPFIGGALETVSRVICSTFLPALFGYAGVCMLEPVAWFLTAFVLFITYRIWASKNR